MLEVKKSVTLIITLVIISTISFYALAASKPIVNIPVQSVGSSAIPVGLWMIQVNGYAYSVENGQKIPLYFQVEGGMSTKYWVGYLGISGIVNITAGGTGYGSGSFTGEKYPPYPMSTISQAYIVSGPWSNISVIGQ